MTTVSVSPSQMGTPFLCANVHNCGFYKEALRPYQDFQSATSRSSSSPEQIIMSSFCCLSASRIKMPINQFLCPL